MPRNARIKSSTNIYHVMLRGNNKQTIFHDPQDHEIFLELLNEKNNKKSITVYAWCLMPNHVHLLVREKDETLEAVFRSMLTSFVYWYNAKYHRTGHVFQDRFKSRPVESQTYFLRVFRYIHQNPLKADLCKAMEDYPYSSYRRYFRSGKYKDEDIILNLMGKDELEQYHQQEDDEDEIMRFNEREKLTEDDIVNMICSSGIVTELSEIKSISRDQKSELIRMLLDAGVSYRKINALTGISMSVIRDVSREFNRENSAEDEV